MNLNRITVAIRPRNQWEAIDAGLLFGSTWFARLWLLWLLSAAPVLVLIILVGLLLPGFAVAKWGLIVFWLGKPLYEPALLHWASRAMFGERLATRQTMREIKTDFSLRRFLLTLGTRISPIRSFTLPVLLLEGLAGKERRKRSALLSRGYETGVYLTVAGSFIEVVIGYSLFGVAFWFIPEGLRWIDFGDFVFQADGWLILAAYFISCSIVAPFYVCAGFMLYLARRVELEAWDIEIGFKKIEQRLRNRKNNGLTLTVLILSLALGLGSFTGSWARATDHPNPQSARILIDQVLSEKEFGTNKTVYRWVPKETESAEPDAKWLSWFEEFFKTLAEFAEKVADFIGDASRYLVWIGGGILLGLLLLRYRRIRKWLRGRLPALRVPVNKPQTLFGMDIRPESLPDDIMATCKSLIEANNKRKALSLLYRSTLSRLIHDHHLQIGPAQTEHECCSEVGNHRPEGEAAYFSALTTLWLTTAYRHQDPKSGDCLDLVNQFQRLYEV